MPGLSLSSFGMAHVAALLSGVLCLSSHAFAQTRSQVYGSALDKQTPTAFVSVDAGLATYESQIAQSNASGRSMRYGIGAYAGERRQLGVFFRQSDTKMNFPLNGNSARTSWREVTMQARFGWFYPAVIASLSEMQVKRGAATYVDIYGTGVGASLGVHVPLLSRMDLHGTGSLVRTPGAVEKSAAHRVALGDRIEVDVGTTFDIIPEFLDLNVGYIYRAHSVGVDEATFQEKQSMPYVGTRVSAYF